MSEATFQATRTATADGVALEIIGGGPFRNYSLRSILWNRVGVGAMDLILEVLDGDTAYEIEHIVGTAATQYHWPNAATPYQMSFVIPQRIRFKTTGAVPGITQSAVMVWADSDVA